MCNRHAATAKKTFGARIIRLVKGEEPSVHGRQLQEGPSRDRVVTMSTSLESLGRPKAFNLS